MLRFCAVSLVLAGVLGGVLGVCQPASAQTPPDQSASPKPADAGQAAPATPATAEKAPTNGKRSACRADAKAKGLKGMDLADSMQLCMAEARVDCVKQAIAKKMPVHDRPAFFKTCIQG